MAPYILPPCESLPPRAPRFDFRGRRRVGCRAEGYLARNSDYRATLYETYVSGFKQQPGWKLEEFFRWCDYKYRPIFDALPREARILELGCGPGRMMEYLVSLGFREVEGIDVSAEQVEIARSRGLNARVADVFEFLAGAGQYDAVVAVDFIEHFKTTELLELMRLIRERLCPGGLLVLQTPNGEGLMARGVIYGDLTHCTIFTTGSLGQLLAASGFGECRFYETGPAPKNLAGKLRAAAWGVVKAGARVVRLIETGHAGRIWTEAMICAARKR